MNKICLNVAIFRYDAEAVLLELVLALRMMRRIIRFVVMCWFVFWHVASSPPMLRCYQFIWRLCSGRLELLADQIPLVVQLLIQAAIAVARIYQQEPQSVSDRAAVAEPDHSPPPPAPPQTHSHPEPVTTESEAVDQQPDDAPAQREPHTAPAPRKATTGKTLIGKVKPHSSTQRQQPTLKQLRKDAATAKISGRSSMNKQALQAALASHHKSQKFCQVKSAT